MRHRIDRIVIHCSATKASQDYSFEQLERDHRLRGFRECGYNFYVRKDGSVFEGRNIGDELAHATGYNRNSIAICYEGGLNEVGMPHDTRTQEQREVLLKMVIFFHAVYPDALVLGHRDLPMVNKDCPCFDVKNEYRLWVH
jgi:hypothetical protein